MFHFQWGKEKKKKRVNQNSKIAHPFWELVVYSKTDTVSEELLLLSWLVSVGMTKPPLPCEYPEVFYKHEKIFQIRWHINNIQLAIHSPIHCICVCVCV
jgi:hypothetical protein